MQVTVIHNPSAGDDDSNIDRLCAVMRANGHMPRAHCSKDGDLAAALAEPVDLVAAVGGDGTLAKMVAALPDRAVPVTLLPEGTANNIAASLGIAGPAEAIIAGWNRGRQQFLDVGRAVHGGQRCLALEGAGLGALAEAMERIEDAEVPSADRLAATCEAFRDILADAAPSSPRVMVDGAALPGDLLMVEVMTLGRVGPSLPLAPQAEPGDGLFDVVYLPVAARQAMLDWLEDPDAGPPPLAARRGARVELVVHDGVFRLGDSFIAADGQPVVLDVDPPPLTVLVPSSGS